MFLALQCHCLILPVPRRTCIRNKERKGDSNNSFFIYLLKYGILKHADNFLQLTEGKSNANQFVNVKVRAWDRT